MVIIVAKFSLSLIILFFITITSTYTSLAIAKGIDRDSSSISKSKEENNLLLEPTVKRHIGILPPETCKELIRLGNLDGFTEVQESIDDYSDSKEKQPSQSIEVFERYDGITHPSIWKVLEPYIPRLTELVQLSIDDDIDRLYYPDEQPNRTPTLGWVFFRKYDPDTPRNSLKLHVDSNMHTLNIALNDNYSGGGLLYIRPSIDAIVEEDGRPQILEQYTTYNWLNNVKRQNTTDVIFPSMNTGDVLIHNFTVWHGVAPLVAGTRYSFVLFYDMDNPAIQDDFYDNQQDNGIIAVFYHEIQDLVIDLVWVGETTQPQEEEDGYESKSKVVMMEKSMKPYKEYAVDTYEGHIFHAIISGTDVVLSKFVIMGHDDENNYENRYVIEKTKGDHSRHDNDEL